MNENTYLDLGIKMMCELSMNEPASLWSRAMGVRKRLMESVEDSSAPGEDTVVMMIPLELEIRIDL